jgi:hypothetical protein
MRSHGESSGEEAASRKADPQEQSAEHEKAARDATAGEGAKAIQEHAKDIDRETGVVTRRADRFDGSELFLEISIVLCSISLLAGTRLYWRLSFITTAIGIAVAIYGALLH